MLDHLVYATPDLASTVADLAARGIVTVPGGPHVGLGTRNHLAGLGGGAYLEVIGPDPEQPAPAGHRPFAIDDLAAPALVAWCARPGRPLGDVRADAVAAGYDPGEAGDMSRRRPDGVLLAWRLTLPAVRPGGGPAVLPFLIDWLDSPHPTASLADGLWLESFVVAHPNPQRVRAQLAALGERDTVEVVEGPAALRASIRTPAGPVTL